MTSAETSILPIITSQRDRFRSRNAELEEVSNKRTFVPSWERILIRFSFLRRCRNYDVNSKRSLNYEPRLNRCKRTISKSTRRFDTSRVIVTTPLDLPTQPIGVRSPLESEVEATMSWEGTGTNTKRV